MAPRKSIPLRLDPAIHEAIARLASDELRSVNAQIELMLREQLRAQGRLPRDRNGSRGPSLCPSRTVCPYQGIWPCVV